MGCSLKVTLRLLPLSADLLATYDDAANHTVGRSIVMRVFLYPFWPLTVSGDTVCLQHAYAQSILQLNVQPLLERYKHDRRHWPLIKVVGNSYNALLTFRFASSKKVYKSINHQIYLAYLLKVLHDGTNIPHR